MKIIKRGTLKIKEKPITVTCEKCESIIEFEPNEIMTYSWRDSFGCGKLCGKKEWVTCPICNNDIILHEYHTK